MTKPRRDFTEVINEMLPEIKEAYDRISWWEKALLRIEKEILLVGDISVEEIKKIIKEEWEKEKKEE